MIRSDKNESCISYGGKMLQIENTNNMPEWLIKCMSCTHAYTTKNDDLEVKCRCRNGCIFKQAKDRPIYKESK